MLTINVSSRNVPIKRFTSMPRIHCISFRSFLQLKYIRNITSTVFQFIIPTYVLHQLGNSLSYFFSIYSTRFNEICLFLSTVPKGTSTSRREMGSWAFWHTVWPHSTVFIGEMHVLFCPLSKDTYNQALWFILMNGRHTGKCKGSWVSIIKRLITRLTL